MIIEDASSYHYQCQNNPDCKDTEKDKGKRPIEVVNLSSEQRVPDCLQQIGGFTSGTHYPGSIKHIFGNTFGKLMGSSIDCYWECADRIFP